MELIHEGNLNSSMKSFRSLRFPLLSAREYNTYIISKERINRRNAVDEKNVKRNVTGPRKPQTNAEQRVTPEESSESEESNIC
jgi:hypothetical protein